MHDPYVTLRRLMRSPARASRLCREGLHSPLLLEWLSGKYGRNSLLKWRGGQYPAQAQASGDLVLVEQESAPLEVRERLVSPRYLRWGDVTHNGEVLEFVRTDGAALVVRRGRYFDMLDTCDAMEWELLGLLGDVAGTGKRPSWRSFESKLTLRNSVEDGQCGACAGMGVSLVVRDRAGRGVRTLVARRAPSRISFRSGKLHVVPAGMLMPGKSIRQSAMQELLEELMGLQEHGGGISGEPEYRRLKRAGAVFATTGLVTNLLNLRGDVCATLTIEDQRWWSREPLWRLNREHGGGLVRIEDAPAWWDIVPQGAGALALSEGAT